METLGSDYVRTAKAKGLTTARSRLQARAEKRAVAGHHPGGPAVSRRDLGRGAGGDRVLLAGPWHAGLPVDHRPRHADDPGHPVLFGR